MSYAISAQSVAKLSGSVGPVAKFLGSKAPVIGAVVNGASALSTVGGKLKEGKHDEALAEAFVGASRTAGGLFGFMGSTVAGELAESLVEKTGVNVEDTTEKTWLKKAFGLSKPKPADTLKAAAPAPKNLSPN